jgi:hypothetical protein
MGKTILFFWLKFKNNIKEIKKMRYTAAFRIKKTNKKQDTDICSYDFNHIGECLEYLNKIYNLDFLPANGEEKIFQWAIIDFEEEKVYFNSVNPLDCESFIDSTIIDLVLNQYLYKPNNK